MPLPEQYLQSGDPGRGRGFGQARARASKRLIEQGYRLPEGTPVRPFYCRHCGKTVRAQSLPKGWYTLQRAPDSTVLAKHQRLGIFCTIACLAAELPRLAGIEEDLGEGWAALTSPYRQD